MRIFIKKKIIIIIAITSIISNTIFFMKNSEYENKFRDIENIELEVIITGNKEEKQYTCAYESKVCKPIKYQGTKIYISQDKREDNVNYGDKIKVYGTFIQPSRQRNYMGFSYKEYLKTKKIYGTVNIKKKELISKGNINYILMQINNIGKRISIGLNKIMSKEAASIVIALILGDTSKIDDETKDNFKNSSLLHILAISGMHISFIIDALTKLSKKTIGKKSSKKYIIIFLVFYAFLVKNSPAILRAVIMGIMQLSATMLKRKNDFWTSLGLSALITLILNPHSILNIGFQLTYLGTAGIIFFQKNIKYLLEKYIKREGKISPKRGKRKLKNKKTKEVDIFIEISASISAQIMILPMVIYISNICTPYFLISSFLIGFVIAYSIYLGFITSFLVLINIKIARIFAIPLEILIQSILTISQISLYYPPL